ncbi:unnamed protein product [Dovyalis caffra]|uniref:Uncharacterized protein n=1 Tax=Dovyalis caffra TaxID=77055 RepID=A0AAV1SHP4_9ROSI|nr:unnamed protein product [Dovyalis caffra]
MASGDLDCVLDHNMERDVAGDLLGPHPDPVAVAAGDIKCGLPLRIKGQVMVPAAHHRISVLSS